MAAATRRFLLQNIFISWRKFKESSSADNVHGLNEPQTKWSDHRSSEKKQLLV